MSTNEKKETSVEKQEGIDVSNVNFDPNGQVDGLDDSVLDDAAGGVLSVDESTNTAGCGNAYKC
jgi:hypothetical protein